MLSTVADATAVDVTVTSSVGVFGSGAEVVFGMDVCGDLVIKISVVGVGLCTSTAASPEMSLRRCRKRSIRSERRCNSLSNCTRPASAVAKVMTASRLLRISTTSVAC